MSFLSENRGLALATPALVLLFVMTPVLSPITANDKQPRAKVYDGPVDRVYAAVVQVASARYNLKSAVKEAYTVNFFTGGQFSLVMSATCHDHGGGKTIVTLSISESERDPQVFFRGKARDDATKRFWSELDSALTVDENLDVHDNVSPPTPPETSHQPRSGATVAITSVPAGAEIFVDQSFVGNTPSSIAVPTGKHIISVRKQGFRDWERALAVSGGAVNLNAELVPGTSPNISNPGVTETTRPEPARIAQEEHTGWIGITTKDDASRGLVITRVLPDSSASQVGLQEGDIIISLNGKPVRSGMEFDVAITRSTPGSQIRLGYIRGTSKCHRSFESGFF
jgi:membrane-associated protease RseP (regulator of RpoE activity)